MENLDEEVLPLSEHCLNGDPFPVDNDLTVALRERIEVTTDGVKFFSINTGNAGMEVSIQDFKTIVLAW